MLVQSGINFIPSLISEHHDQMLQRMSKLPALIMSLKIIHFRLLPHLPGANELYGCPKMEFIMTMCSVADEYSN